MFRQFIYFGQPPQLTSLSISECTNICTAPNAVFKQEFTNEHYKISFGLLETCHHNDTLLINLVADTIKIQIGERKLIKTINLEGITYTTFKPSDEEECDCFYKYELNISNLKLIPKQIVVENKIHDEKHGFIPLKLKKDSTFNKNISEFEFPVGKQFLLTGLRDQSSYLRMFLKSNPSLKIKVFYPDNINKFTNKQIDEYNSLVKTIFDDMLKYGEICEYRLNFMDFTKKKIIQSKKSKHNTDIPIYALIIDTGSFLFTKQDK